MSRCMGYGTAIFAAVWLAVSLLIAVTLWISYARSGSSYERQTCYVQNVSVTSQNCNINGVAVALDVIPNYTPNATGPVRRIYGTSCTSINNANEVAAMYKNGTLFTCYVDKTDPSDILFTLSNMRLRALISAVVPTMLMLIALSYAVYICLRHFMRRRGGNNGFRENVEAGSNSYMDEFRSLGISGDGSTRPAAAATIGSSRCLTVDDASRIVRELTVDATTVKVSEDTVCVICLEDVLHGSAKGIAVLPCAHAFHPTCITQWLTKGNKLCPCCNHDLTKIVRTRAPDGTVATTAETASVDTQATMGTSRPEHAATDEGDYRRNESSAGSGAVVGRDRRSDSTQGDG